MKESIDKTHRESHFTGGQIHHGFSRVLRKGFALSDGRGYCKQCNWEWFEKTKEIINPKTHVIIHKNGNKLDDRFENLKKVTKEEHKKMRYKQVSEKLQNRTRSPETRRKISNTLRGKSYLTNEGREKISIASKNRIYTPEMKENMSLAQKKAYQTGKTKLFGKNNPAWRGGIWKNEGYIYIHKPGFPTANSKGYIKRANYIWFQHTKEIIILPLFLHHKNGNKEDDRFKNLQKTTRKEHMDIHRKDLK